MRNYLSTLALLLLSSFIVNAENELPRFQHKYLLHINRANLFIADSLYKQACKEYEIAFSYRNDFLPDLFSCAETYDKLGNSKKTIKYLKLSIERGCDWYQDSSKLPNLKRTTDDFKLSKYEIFKQLFYKDLDVYYLNQLERLVARDQSVRGLHNSEMLKDTDAANMVELMGLIEQYGYPGYSNVGYKGETDAFILLLHGLFDGVSDSLNWVYYQPVILKMVKSGKLMPMHYAWLYDRVVSKSGREKQCYGSQVSIDENMRFVLQVPVYDIENVDKRRAEIGLPPLEDDCRISKIKLPEGYKRK